MKITNVNPKTIKWKKPGGPGRRSCNSSLYEKIRHFEMGKAIRVELNEPRKNLGALMQAYFRKSRYPDFRVKSLRVDKEGKVWFFQKRKR